LLENVAFWVYATSLVWVLLAVLYQLSYQMS